MPLNSAQLAALVERAKTKPPLVVPTPPAPPRPVRPAKPAPALKAETPRPTVTAPAVSPPPPPLASQSPTVEAEDFPIGWNLKKDSWHFHRRFYAVFRRTMAHGEYTQLLRQIYRGQAEDLGDNCWRVTLPGSSRTLPVRATRWRLITILPKNWQPPAAPAPSPSDPALASELVQTAGQH